MQGFDDSDATYCSQVENESTQQSTHSHKSDLFNTVRRSQRLIQRYSRNMIDLNTVDICPKEPLSPPCTSAMCLQGKSQSSTHFHPFEETDVCSQKVDCPKDVATTVQQCSQDVKVIDIKQSVDVFANLETPTLTQEIPSNQKQLFDQELRSKLKVAAEIDLTRSPTKHTQRTSKRRQRKKEVCVIDLTHEVTRLDGGCAGVTKKHQRKTKAKESLCDIEPKIPRTDKLDLSSPTLSVFPLKSEDLKKFQEKLKANSKKRNVTPKTSATVAAPSTPPENYFKATIQLDCEKRVPKKAKQQQNPRRRKIRKNKRRSPIQTQRRRTKTKKEMITRYLNLADFVDNDIENERKRKFNKNRYPRSPLCPDNCTCTNPIPTKPVPMLRSVANSMLPKVYPPHFINQKPPIDTRLTGHIPYEQTHQRERAACQRTDPNRHRYTKPYGTVSSVTSPMENKARIPLNTTSMFKMCPPSSPATPIKAAHARPHSVTPDRRFIPNYLTPDQTQSPLNGRTTTTSTTPSLPDSLKGVFESDDIREILNIDKAEYNLCDNHVKALAIVLNIRVENLREVLRNILKLDQTVLKKIESAMKAMPKESSESTKVETGCFVRNLMSPPKKGNNKNFNAKPTFFNWQNRV